MMRGVETERLLLRPFTADDLPALTELHSIEAFWWYPLRRAMTPEETRAFLERRFEHATTREYDLWAAIEKESDALVGWAGLNAPEFLPEIMPAVEVGWRFDPAVWGRGLASEAGTAGLDYGFEMLGLDEIVSVCERENIASARVMQRIGMRRISNTVHPAEGYPIWVYAITATEWQAQRASGGTVRET